MPCFLAYFDLLGYKNFIENNTSQHLDFRTDHFARNIERALSLDHPLIQTRHGGVVSDISKSRLNCLNFSDTVVLWTNHDTFDEFEELFMVAYKYNSFNVLHDFPSRGCIVYGDLWYKPFDRANLRGGRYALNMIYGKALIDAHLKAENISMAGCIIDQSAIDRATALGNVNPLLQKYTIVHDVPYKTKTGEVKISERALRLLKGEVLISKHIENGIAQAFTQDNKGTISGRVKEIYDNTIEFLMRHKVPLPLYYRIDMSTSGLSTEVFGRLEEDLKHTIVTRTIQDNGTVSYHSDTKQFDTDKDDRDFLDAPRITENDFLDQLQQAIPGHDN